MASWPHERAACLWVRMQRLFSRFDADTVTLKLYKLCTIGDAYVAVSGLQIDDDPRSLRVRREPDDARRVLRMAKTMQNHIRQIRTDLQIPSLDMRIGLHVGSCVGGVIGSGRLRYDLWGEDVLVGNAIEMKGVPGSVCCSREFKEQFSRERPHVFDSAVYVHRRTVLSSNRQDKGVVAERLHSRASLRCLFVCTAALLFTFCCAVARRSSAVFVPLKKITVNNRQVQLFAVFDAFGSHVFSERSDGFKG